jgi:mannose-1-phosphate guanylyltransferase
MFSPSSAEFIPILLAGGKGARLWPLSTKDRPKPFLRPPGCAQSLIRTTWLRFNGVEGAASPKLSTTSALASALSAELPELRPNDLLLEPESRDTAPAVLLNALQAAESHPRAVLGFFPSDHLIANEDHFRDQLSVAIALSTQQPLLTLIGITPRSPSTQYGYIQRSGSRGIGFSEKPSHELAERLIASAALWNCGMFIGTAQAFISAFTQVWGEERVAALRIEIQNARELSRETYQSLPKNSFDREVLEHLSHFNVVETQLERIDVGNLKSIASLIHPDSSNNRIWGNVRTNQCRDSVILNSLTNALEATDLKGEIFVRGPGGDLRARLDELDALKAFQEEQFQRSGATS